MSCSATGRRFSGRDAIQASRCCRPIRICAGRRDSRLRRSPPPSRRGPPRRPSRPLRRDFLARWVVTPPSEGPEPSISRRSTPSERGPLGEDNDTSSGPSTVNSASARSTSPTVAPGGRRLAETTPLGCFAPAARHVSVPSPRSLVISMSMRVAMQAPSYLPRLGHHTRRRSIRGRQQRKIGAS